MYEALDIVIPVNGGNHLTIISAERGFKPASYYCIDENGNGDWFAEDEIRIARTSDLSKRQLKSKNNVKSINN